MAYSPPFELSTQILNHVANISVLVGSWVVQHDRQPPSLRRENRIKTIQASLAVEQNTLSLEQVTAVIDGKRVLGHPREVQEVVNAFAAYESLPKWQPHSLDDLCAAHQFLMQGLIAGAGHWRCGGAGIYRGNQLVHMAPPANQVPRLMKQLADWLASTNVHPVREVEPEMRVKTRVEMRVKTPEAILSLLQENPRQSLASVAQQLGVATSTVERAVAKLQQEGRLKRIGPRKGGTWHVS